MRVVSYRFGKPSDAAACLCPPRDGNSAGVSRCARFAGLPERADRLGGGDFRERALGEPGEMLAVVRAEKFPTGGGRAALVPARTAMEPLRSRLWSSFFLLPGVLGCFGKGPPLVPALPCLSLWVGGRLEPALSPVPLLPSRTLRDSLRALRAPRLARTRVLSPAWCCGRGGGLGCISASASPAEASSALEARGVGAGDCACSTASTISRASAPDIFQRYDTCRTCFVSASMSTPRYGLGLGAAAWSRSLLLLLLSRNARGVGKETDTMLAQLVGC